MSSSVAIAPSGQEVFSNGVITLLRPVSRYLAQHRPSANIEQSSGLPVFDVFSNVLIFFLSFSFFQRASQSAYLLIHFLGVTWCETGACVLGCHIKGIIKRILQNTSHSFVVLFWFGYPHLCLWWDCCYTHGEMWGWAHRHTLCMHKHTKKRTWKLYLYVTHTNTCTHTYCVKTHTCTLAHPTLAYFSLVFCLVALLSCEWYETEACCHWGLRVLHVLRPACCHWGLCVCVVCVAYLRPNR